MTTYPFGCTVVKLLLLFVLCTYADLERGNIQRGKIPLYESLLILYMFFVVFFCLLPFQVSVCVNLVGKARPVIKVIFVGKLLSFDIPFCI